MSVKVNRIELDKTNGLTIQVLNGAFTQTIFLDGQQITITVAGPSGQSTIVQTPNSVTINADAFTVTAKTATINTLPTSLALTMASATLESAAVSLVGTGTITETAPTIELTAATEMTLTAPTGIVINAPDLVVDGIPIP